MVLTHTNIFIQAIHKLLATNSPVKEIDHVAHLVDSSKQVLQPPQVQITSVVSAKSKEFLKVLKKMNSPMAYIGFKV